MSTTPATASVPRILEALGERVLFDPSGTYVESRSTPGTFHRLTLAHGCVIACDCPGFTYRGRCRHLAAASEALRIAGIGPNEWDCGCWKPWPFERGSDLWGYCRRCGGVL